jgi:hypothetical protein
MNILTQDTVSVSRGVDQKQLQTLVHLNVYIRRGREMLSGKLKVLGRFNGKKKTIRTWLHLLMEVKYHLLRFCCCSFYTMLQSLKGLTLQ